MSNEQIQTIYENNLKLQATLDALQKAMLSELEVDTVAMVQIALDYANKNNAMMSKAV